MHCRSLKKIFHILIDLLYVVILSLFRLVGFISPNKVTHELTQFVYSCEFIYYPPSIPDVVLYIVEAIFQLNLYKKKKYLLRNNPILF